MELLERERELAELDALLLDAKAGEARLALIEGPAGIGKTQLMAELRRRAGGAGLRVLSARGSELEREFPFGVVRQLFEPALGDDAFAGAAEAARPVFAAPDDGAETGAASFSTLHGLYWLALNLSEGNPLLIAVDDLHWADAASLRFLAYALRRVEGVPILFAAGLRSAEPGTDPGLLAEIIHDPLTVQVHPGPLSMEGIAAMVVDVFGAEPHMDFTAACYQATGGNPLLLRQLRTALAAEKIQPEASQARVVREIGPRAVSRTVILRLARLSQEAQRVARAVAILGEDAALHTAATVAGLDEATAARATGELATAEILRHGSPLGFVHPLVRDAVYRELPPGERELQHAQVARMLHELGAPLEQVAAHLLMTSPRGDEWVAEALQEAGRAAIRKGAADSAPSYLRRALREPISDAKRPQLLLELGVAEILSDGGAALEHLRMAYETLSDPLTKGIAAAALGRVVMFTGDPPEASRLARKAAAELPPELADLRQGLEAFEACTHFFADPDWSDLPDLERYRTPPPPDAGVGEKALAAVAGVYWAYSGGSADECCELALAALAGGDLMRADNGLLGIAATRPLIIADREEVMDAWDQALAEAHRRGSIFELAGLHLWYGFTQYWRGELSDAEATLRTAIDELGRWGFRANADWYGAAFLGATLIARGNVAGAREVIAQVPDATGRTSDGARAFQHIQVALALAEGRYDEAITGTNVLESTYGDTVNPADSPWRSFRAFALHKLGRDKEAEAVALEELELAQRWGSPGTLGRVLRTLGRTRGEAGIKHIQDAIDVM